MSVTHSPPTDKPPYYQRGDVTLYHGDCLEYMKTMPENSVDAVVTDPPWMDYETGMYDASEWHRPVGKMQPSEYCNDLFRVLKDRAAIILWCRWDVFHEHAASLAESGFDVRNCIVWDKGTHTAGDLDGNIGYQHEQAVFAVKGCWKRHTKREVNMWRVPHLFSKEKRDHPTEKPVPLMSRSVQLVAQRGDTVFDPFMGSGTTGVACVKLGRKFIGCELDESYCAIAAKRISQAQDQLTLDIA